LFYSLAAGFSLPTQRALVMVAVVMAAIFLRRQLSAGYGLLLALLICLLLDPLAPASLSFWLSFSAVSVIVYGLCGRVMRTSWWQGLRVQWLAFIGLLPVLAVFFGQLSGLSPLANTVLVPVFSLFIVPLNFLSMLLVVVMPQWAGALFSLLDQVLGWQLDYLAWLLAVPFPTLLKVPAVHGFDLLLACVGVVILLLPRAMPLRCCGLVLMAPLLLTRPVAINKGDMVLTVLDVGQGLSVVVQTAKHVLVYDIGPAFSDSFSTGSAVVAPYLNNRGVDRVDMLVLSHSDNDHSGNWAQFIERVDVKGVAYGEALVSSPRGLTAHPCLAGEPWVWDDVTFSFYHPAGDERGTLSANNMSCVLKISTAGTSVLLTGDIERPVEARLVSSLSELLVSDILVAPHHGSKTSSSWPFIRSVKPKHIVFTTGYRNRFGHPHSDIVKRYRLQGTEIYNSASDGAIIFTVKQGKISSVQRYRSQLNRYWL
jgi:competence protein ComEC